MTIKKNKIPVLVLTALVLGGCAKQPTASTTKPAATEVGLIATDQPAPVSELKKDDFEYVADQFSDLRILRYQIPGFEELTAKQKELLYYLYEAALSGRDIIYDQNFKHNLTIRRTLDAIVETNQNKEAAGNGEWDKFMTYTKRVWFSNGIHHHYSTRKFLPEFSKAYFAQLVKDVPADKLPLQKGETVDKWLQG